jgi:catechol 2,3-dioxygenase-like lactoylglutathione lyase family enzyme
LAISDTGEDRVKEIDHIGVVVDNLEEAEAFLADVLKLEPERKLNAHRARRASGGRPKR